MLPLISIIIPTYNHAQFITEAVGSVLAQGYPNLEIILIDDGSTDGTADIAEHLLAKSECVHKVVRQVNQGAHITINTGLNLAQGDYLAILNSDDRYTPDRISKLHRHALQMKSRFVFSRVRYMDRDGNSLPDSAPHNYYYRRALSTKDLFPTPNFELLRHQYALTTGNYFFHRSILDQVGLFRDFRLCHDWDFILRVLLVEDPCFYDEALYEYRLHGQNTITSSGMDARYQEIEEVVSHYLSHAESAVNPLAPALKNWGAYWNYFLVNHMKHLQHLPKVAATIQAIIETPARGTDLEKKLIATIASYDQRLNELNEESERLQKQIAQVPREAEVRSLPPRILFYFWLRKLVYPLYKRIGGEQIQWLQKFKHYFKWGGN